MERGNKRLGTTRDAIVIGPRTVERIVQGRYSCTTGETEDCIRDEHESKK